MWAYIMPRERKLRMALDLARALRECQRATVIHCDIKPANMLLHEPADFGERRGSKHRLLKLIYVRGM